MELKNRILIQEFLKMGLSLSNISKRLNLSKSTISREIKNNRTFKLNIRKISLSKNTIDDNQCSLLKKPPYVCNNCIRYIKNTCVSNNYLIYDANIAIIEANKRRISNNIVNDKELIIKDINNLLKKRQPISHIHASLSKKYNNMPSKQTIYNWINKGIITYSKQKYRQKHFKDKNEIKLQYNWHSNYLKGKQREDYLEYVFNNNKTNICEIDLICGKQGTSGYFLVIFMPKIQFSLIYKLENKSPSEVIRVFDMLENKIGTNKFKKLFGILLTDRGSEFLKHKEIETSVKTKFNRTKIFYCDPAKPYQKAYVENINKLIRRTYPKGIDLSYVKQDSLNKLTNNINSLIKVKYNNKTPNEMFIELFGISIFKQLSLEVIKANDVELLP